MTIPSLDLSLIRKYSHNKKYGTDATYARVSHIPFAFRWIRTGKFGYQNK